MIKLNINKLELPVLDVILATPILIPLEKGKILHFKIPSVKNYFVFESKYLSLIANYFVLFSKIDFLTVKEFADMKLKEKMMKELMIVIQNKKFKKDFSKIIQEYFTGNFNLKKIYSVMNPLQFSYLFLFIHNIVENVKKNFQVVAKKVGVQMKEIFSTSLKSISTKIEPRF